MFLHLGGDVVVPKKDIIAIFNARARSAPATREFIEIAGDEGFLKKIPGQKKEKSYVITLNKIFLSPISCATLNKRTKKKYKI
jgi:hypothetical protein